MKGWELMFWMLYGWGILGWVLVVVALALLVKLWRIGPDQFATRGDAWVRYLQWRIAEHRRDRAEVSHLRKARKGV